jgi:hypothetical protein
MLLPGKIILASSNWLHLVKRESQDGEEMTKVIKE